jgi:hypothetical protein
MAVWDFNLENLMNDARGGFCDANNTNNSLVLAFWFITSNESKERD